MTSNTRDLMQFGYRELGLAGDLLKVFKSNKDVTTRLGNDIAIEFNPVSGNVFLVDEDYNVAMMNGEVLEDFLTNPETGEEGFASEMSEDNL